MRRIPHWELWDDQLFLYPSDGSPKMHFKLSTFNAFWVQFVFPQVPGVPDGGIRFDHWERAAPQDRTSWDKFISHETYAQLRIFARMLMAAYRHEHHAFSVRIGPLSVTVKKIEDGRIETLVDGQPVEFHRISLERGWRVATIGYHPEAIGLCQLIWQALDNMAVGHEQKSA